MDQLDQNLERLRLKVDRKVERYLIARAENEPELEPEAFERSVFKLPERLEPMVIELANEPVATELTQPIATGDAARNPSPEAIVLSKEQGFVEEIPRVDIPIFEHKTAPPAENIQPETGIRSCPDPTIFAFEGAGLSSSPQRAETAVRAEAVPLAPTLPAVIKRGLFARLWARMRFR